MKLRPIFKCHGGKSYLKEFIIAHFPKNYKSLRYFEACGGAASVLLNKDKSIEETYNDADPRIASIVTTLASPNFDLFIKRLKDTPYTEEMFKWAQDAAGSSDEISMQDVAYSELIIRRMSRGGLRQAFGWSERLRGGEPGDLHAWKTFKEQLPLIAFRLQDVHVFSMDVIDFFKRFDAEGTLWYIDPPYLQTTRSSKDVYTFEMSEEQHIELGKALNNAKGKVLLSGYQSDLYTKMYKGWNMDCRAIANHSSQSKIKQKRVEILWMNY
jgi:DNA adenine methylase